LLIADEIQTGIGRTGKMFAVEHSGVVPDLITLAKGLGGGTPISGVVGRADVIDAVPPGGLGSTYAGSPMATTAALVVLDLIQQEGQLARATVIGERMRERFRAFAQQHKSIGDVRGLGAMTGVELCLDGDLHRPATELVAALKTECAARGLIILTCGNTNNVIRMMPALTIEDAVLEEGLDIVEQALLAIQAP
ncbi:MAG: aminotransferase class III-fold pyridoxal phosphate-dependent enzyme, partial [Pseudohongiella sp.]|nr:aminotransferase class III-fold pyridoxal phosphate-dependent enzyme [Pseudohongiella sp.]